jgi:2-(1,2-epoxy-1,2-dihydrophenyl)acetyl-CoA isomerase
MTDILFERRSGMAFVTLNRPETRNAVTEEMARQLHAFLLSVESDSSIRCVLLRGAGDHFMAGGDVKNFAGTLDLSAEERRRQFEARAHAITPLLLTLERMPQIVVAAVKGACAGIGMSWVAAADLTIAARSAFFVQAQIKIGCSPDGSGSYWPVRAVGLKRAKQMALLGERIDAEQAERWGFVNWVVDDAQFETAVDQILQKLASGPSFALGATKRLLNGALETSYPSQLASEARAFSACTADEDFAEGVRAFFEKRSPSFGQRAR